jgi:hypothetical protein
LNNQLCEKQIVLRIEDGKRDGNFEFKEFILRGRFWTSLFYSMPNARIV